MILEWIRAGVRIHCMAAFGAAKQPSPTWKKDFGCFVMKGSNIAWLPGRQPSGKVLV